MLALDVYRGKAHQITACKLNFTPGRQAGLDSHKQLAPHSQMADITRMDGITGMENGLE